MRVLSFIPAFLVAAASFVAAAPTTVLPTCVSPSGTPSVPSGVAAPTSTGAASVPATGTCSGNDAPLQPIITILVNATTQIQPLSDQLSGVQQTSGSPDCDEVSGIIVQITAVISTCVVQLQAVAQVDLTGLDLTNLCATIYALLSLVLTILNTLVAIVVALGINAVGTLQTVLSNLLNAVVGLTGCLKVFITASLTGVLGPVMSLVCGVIELLLSLVGGLTIIAGSN